MKSNSLSTIIKLTILGFGVFGLLSVSFAANPGTFGNMFMWDGSSYKFLGSKIAFGTIDGSTKLQDGTITTSKIADGTVGIGDVDPSQIQLRTGGMKCPQNDLSYAIQSINQDGSVNCVQVTYLVNPPAPSCSSPTPCGTPGSCYAVSGCDNTCGSIKTLDCAGVCGGNAIDYNGSIAGCGTPPPAPSCSGTLPQNATSNATSPSGTWNYSSTPGACTFACNTNYAWNGTSCAGNTTTTTCGGTYTGTPTTGTTYIQQWNGSIYSPSLSWSTSNQYDAVGNLGCTYSGSVVANGKCNSTYNGQLLSTPPTLTMPLCSVGTIKNLQGPTYGDWIWDCVGENGGMTDYCSAVASFYTYSRSYMNPGSFEFADHVIDGAYTVMNAKPQNWCAEIDANRGLFTATNPSSSNAIWSIDKNTWDTNNSTYLPGSPINAVYSHWSSVPKGTNTCSSYPDGATFSWGTYNFIPEQTYIQCSGAMPTHAGKGDTAIRQTGTWHYSTAKDQCSYVCSGNWQWNGTDCNTCGLTSADCGVTGINGSSCICNRLTCFPAGTKVSMADGSQKNIEDVKIGDKVVTYDELLGANVISPVSETLHHPTQPQTIYTITLDDGTSLSPNAVHPLYEAGSRQYHPASEIVSMFRNGDNPKLKKIDGSIRSIISISEKHENIPTYNLHVVGVSNNPTAGYFFGIGHNYYANGILVHNQKKIVP